MRSNKTRVVNRHFEAEDVYVGRGSLFGNPFEIGRDGDRAEVLEKYKDLFYKKIKKDRFRSAVDGLKGKRLGCTCRPRAGFQGKCMCHGQIIAAYLENIKPEEVP